MDLPLFLYLLLPQQSTLTPATCPVSEHPPVCVKINWINIFGRNTFFFGINLTLVESNRKYLSCSRGNSSFHRGNENVKWCRLVLFPTRRGRKSSNNFASSAPSTISSGERVFESGKVNNVLIIDWVLLTSGESTFHSRVRFNPFE